VIQYLGSDYPLYYDDYIDLPDILSDPLFLYKVADAHNYLVTCRARKELDIGRFSELLDSFVASI
jgi:hypothetical protein